MSGVAGGVVGGVVGGLVGGVRQPGDFGPAYVEAFSSGQLARVLQLYEPTAVVQGRDGRRHDGLVAIEALFEPILARGLRMETVARHLVEQGDLTLIRFDYRLFDGAGTPVHSASSSEVLRRSADGCWRLVIDLPSGADA